MSDLVDGGADGLHLAHTLPDGDALAVCTEIAVHVRCHGLESDWDRRGPAQGLHKYLVLPHVTGEVLRQLREGLAVGLRDIEHRHRAEQGHLELLFLHNDVAVLVQHGCFSVRVNLLPFHLSDDGGGRNDVNGLLSPVDMPPELLPPLLGAGYTGGIGQLHLDEKDISGRVVVKARHGGQVFRVLPAVEYFADALLQLAGQILHPLLPAGIVFLWHGGLLSESIKNAPTRGGKFPPV